MTAQYDIPEVLEIFHFRLLTTRMHINIFSNFEVVSSNMLKNTCWLFAKVKIYGIPQSNVHSTELKVVSIGWLP